MHVDYMYAATGYLPRILASTVEVLLVVVFLAQGRPDRVVLICGFGWAARSPHLRPAHPILHDRVRKRKSTRQPSRDRAYLDGLRRTHRYIFKKESAATYGFLRRRHASCFDGRGGKQKVP
jgi:hypothetical protein